MRKITTLLFSVLFWSVGVLADAPETAAKQADNFLWQCSFSENTVRGAVGQVSCQVAAGCYLYAENTVVTAVAADGRKIVLDSPQPAQSPDGTAIYPAGKWLWQLKISDRLQAVKVDFQGCIVNRNGDICLMPQEMQLWSADSGSTGRQIAAADNLQLPPALAAALNKFTLQKKLSGLPEMPELEKFLQNPAEVPEIKSAAATADKSFYWVFLLVILGGLALNLTPCILPMIPINLAIIGAGSGSSRYVGFRRGAAYALGITLAYGTLGAVAALTGSGFGELNSSSIFNWIVAGIFLLLGLGMFGVYELDLSRFSNLLKRKGGNKPNFWPEVTALGMGIMAALLAGACVAPVVITVVVLAAKLYSEGSYWGLSLPFILGASMALPWPLLGAGLSVLPKPGAWMKYVKSVMGIVIIAMALYYGYLGWTLRSGAFDQNKALQELAVELEAAAPGQLVLVDCWASWCKNCHALEKVLTSEKIQHILQRNRIKVIRFQAEKLSDPGVRAWMEKYSLPGLPALLLLQKGSQR